MKFDKSKILTVVTADNLKCKQKGWVHNSICLLRIEMNTCEPYPVFLSNDLELPFVSEGKSGMFFYPAPEPTYRPYNNDELNDLVGKVLIQNHTGNAMMAIKVVDGEVGKLVSLGGSQKRNAQQLLDGWTHKNGEPCGVREDRR
jgi:hypothetical protein